MAFFRPGKNDDKRPKFNIAHRFIGVLTFLLSGKDLLFNFYS